jgi:NADH-quinone oxidoreductase subunit E
MLSEKTRKAILELQKKYPRKRSALIPALHLAQAEVGYLPSETQNEIAELFEIAPNEVNAVVSFYDMFFEKPVGKHLIHVCKNVSCMLHGADEILEELCHKLKVNPREMTEDGEFTVIPSECLAACDRAPMMIVDEKVVGPVKERDFDAILDEAKKGRGHPSPLQNVESENGHA